MRICRWLRPSAFALVLFVFAAAAAAQNKDAAATAPTAASRKYVTVATYNLENCFDVFDDPYTLDETTLPKSRSAIDKIAALIRKLNPDVMAFQELENEGVLRAIVNELLSDLGYKYIAVGKGNDGRGINVGVISRLPIESVTSYRYLDLKLPDDERTWHFARDLMRVRLTVDDNRSIDLFTVHYKSKRDSADDPKSGKWRLAEATMTRRIIDKALAADPNAWVVLLGDFNDTPETATLTALLDKGEGDRPALVDLHAAVPAEQRITFLNEPYRSTIDYILASPALASRVEKESAKVVAEESLLEGSDHAPVVARFRIAE